jgi:hypothetical protein
VFWWDLSTESLLSKPSFPHIIEAPAALSIIFNLNLLSHEFIFRKQILRLAQSTTITNDRAKDSDG